MIGCFTLLTIDWSMWGAIGTLIGALVAILYTIFTYKLLKANQSTVETNNKLVEFQIYNEIAKLLATEKAKSIVEKCRAKSLSINNSNEICFDLLNPLEDLAKFHEDGLVSLASIDSGFGFMILSVGNNQEIITLIKEERNTHPTLYSGFEKLYIALYSKCSPEEKKNYREKLF